MAKRSTRKTTSQQPAAQPSEQPAEQPTLPMPEAMPEVAAAENAPAPEPEPSPEDCEELAKQDAADLLATFQDLARIVARIRERWGVEYNEDLHIALRSHFTPENYREVKSWLSQIR